MNEKYKKLLSEEEAIEIDSEYFIEKQPNGGGKGNGENEDKIEEGNQSGEKNENEEAFSEGTDGNNESDSLSEIEGELDSLLQEMEENDNQLYEESNEEIQNPEKGDDSNNTGNPFNGTSSYELTDGEDVVTSVKKDREFLRR